MSGSKRTEQVCRQDIVHIVRVLMSKTQTFPDSGGGAPSPGLKKSSGSRSSEQLALPTKRAVTSMPAFQKPLRRGRAYWDLTEPLSLMENEEEVHWAPRLPVQETQADSLDDQLETSAPDME